MKDDFKQLIKEFLAVPLFSYFDKHRRQGRIFFRGLICALQVFAIVFGLTYGIISAIGSVLVIKTYFLDTALKFIKISQGCNLI